MSQLNKEIVLDFYRAWDEASDRWWDLLTEDFQIHFGGLPIELGREDMAGFNEKFYATFEPRRHEWHAQYAEGDMVCSRGAFIATCTGAHGGDAVRGGGLHLVALTHHRIENGRVAEEWLCVAPRPNPDLPHGEPMASLLAAILEQKSAVGGV